MGPFLSPYHHILYRTGSVWWFNSNKKVGPEKELLSFVRSMQNSPVFTYECQMLFTWQNTALFSQPDKSKKQGPSLIVSKIGH